MTAMTALHRIETFAPPPTTAATQPPPKTVPPAHVGQGVTPLPLPAPQVAAPGRWRRFWQSRGATLLMGALSIASVLLFWQLATHYKLDAYIRFNNIPTPAQVLEKVVEVNSSPKFVTNIGISVRRILLGFLVATVLGVGLGLLVGRYRMVRGLVMPAMEVFRPIPAIAWVPMSIMLWPDNEVSIVFILSLIHI